MSRPAPISGAVTGALAGLAAAYTMSKFQAALSSIDAAPSGSDDPSTVKAAERLHGGAIAKPDKAAAGEAVHYAFGAALGLLYGAGAELIPAMAAGGGLPFGLAVAFVADEIAVPAAGLSGPPSDTPPLTHIYSLASHMVFGATLDAVRRVLNRI